MHRSPATRVLVTLLLLLSSSFSHSFIFANYHTLLSHSHNLATRVANLRASRGEQEGAARARAIARNIESWLGLGFYKRAWSMGWDYIKNYAWGGTMSFGTLRAVLSDVNDLMGYLSDLTRPDSHIERLEWVRRNYMNVLRASSSLVGRLLKEFRQSGPLREVLEMLQKEVIEGDFLRDCLEVGGNDLKGLIQVLKDISLQYAPRASSRNEL